MPSTLVEKIIARAAGKSRVAPGDIVTCKVDLAMFRDAAGPGRIAPRLKELGATVWDPSRVVVVNDHSTLAQRAHLMPGAFCASGDGHPTLAGAFGCYLAGFGATEMTGVMATGKIWTRVPESVLVRLAGKLPDGTTAKDIMFFLCRRLGSHNSLKVIEYSGSTIEQLSMSERMALTNLAAELGADTALIAPDAVTLEAIRTAGGDIDPNAANNWRSDPGAFHETVCDIDASTLVPQIARPESPAKALPITDAQGARIDQAYIGAYVGAKLSELRMAARVLKDRRVAKGVRLLIAPASAQTARTATADGTLTTLVEAGAVLLPTATTSPSSTAAGFFVDGENRMRHSDADVYLGSPYTVAASAIAGRITDPRPYLEGRAI
jgi:3-isopropylmalate/(R)-2-methylmalate dehydratase large subunit